MSVSEQGLPLTGERTVPGIARENYWFRRHEAVYEWIRSSGIAGVAVEAGCGEGYGAELLRQAGAEVIAVDYDETAVSHVSDRYPEVSAVRANLVDLPLDDGCADLLVSLQVIEHLWDLAGFFREAHRVLRPGGRIVVSTPNRLTFSPGLGRGEKPTNPFHVEEFDADQIGPLLTEAGFIDPRTFGLFLGPRLTQLEADRGPLVQRQVDAILAEEWPEQLDADVAAVTVADFTVELLDDNPDLAASSLDLIGTARKAGG